MTDNKFTFVNIDELESEHIAAPQYSYWKSVFKKFFASKVTIFFLVVSIIVLALALIQPMLSGYNPSQHVNINVPGSKFNPPNATEWFGTDSFGDSLFDQVWLGARTSLFIAFSATAITTVLGVIVGAFWGYLKSLDKFMLEIYNVIANVPFTLLVFVLMYILGRGTTQLIFSLSVTSWLNTAYFIRVQVMIIRDREYNLASRCLGTSNWNIVKNNVLPYLISVIVTSISRDIPSFISLEVFLSYLGIGVGEKTASLGKTISDNTVYLAQSPHTFWIPVAVLALITISLYVVGQNLADASDPKTHI
ncbi:MAG: oligopeptide ABC transporter permease OppC [Anaerorhabdus sp.]|uniref:oligopeptide ABC transporter permease OppC n=1 Tax=Anaerorhabdus sp. TaxID=1872524 RepID=UPI003A890A1B